MLIAGQLFTDEIIERIRATVRNTADLTRCGLSRLVCEWMNWRNPAGKLRDSSCRPALLKLEALGLIQLPGAKPVGFGGTSRAKATEVEPEWTKLRTKLSKVSGIKLVLVNGKKKLSSMWRVMMNTHHPLGAGPLCGARLRYLIDSDHGYLGALSFSSPARRLSARDLYIGWTERA